MNRLVDNLADLRRNGRKALSIYLTAGFPTPSECTELVGQLDRAGADVIELGIAFSDPIADGPVIQETSRIGLTGGMNIRKALEIVENIRKISDIPVVLMSYFNPVHAFGLEQFMAGASARGVDGVIIPDLPPEENESYPRLGKLHNLSTIYLAAPTTPDERITALDVASTGFLYGVAVTGVTGQRDNLANQTLDFVRRARQRVTRNPLLIGFGIGKSSHAARIAEECDGIIIGSAFLRILSTHGTDAAIQFVAEVRSQLDHPS